MRYILCTLLALVSIGGLFFVVEIARAEDVYSWHDSRGNVFFGSNPPKNAVDLKKVGPHKISRYSSERVVNGFKVSDKNSRGILKKSSGNTAGAGNAPRIKGSPAHLTYESPIITFNDRGEITSCAVEVSNEGKSLAADVLVQMTFPDGTFITAVGPEKLKAGEQSNFGLPENSVPLRISLKGNEHPTAETVKPEITISYQ